MKTFLLSLIENTNDSTVATDINMSADAVKEFIHNLLQSIGIGEAWIGLVNFLVLLAAAIIIVIALQKLVSFILTLVLNRAYKISNLKFLHFTIKNRLPFYLGMVVPYTFVVNVIPLLFGAKTSTTENLLILAKIYLVFMVIWTIMAVIRSLGDVLQEKESFKGKPMQSYMQVIQIVFFIIGAIKIYSIMTGNSATGFFAAMGAASAVVMLVFSDTIKGFVASIQLSSNNMVMIGDWITMNKYGADGNVAEINLTTVKVINFDRTITTIPTYSLISDSFQNWRGMQEYGARRFTRSLNINQSDIAFLSDEELEEMKKIVGLADFINQKQAEYKAFNSKQNADGTIPLNQLRITNCDLFVQYAIWQLKNSPYIQQNATLLVRTLAPEEMGLPVQVYAFTNTSVWAQYEMIVTEIMNRLISSLSFFKLRVFTNTAADDYVVYIKENQVITDQANKAVTKSAE